MPGTLSQGLYSASQAIAPSRIDPDIFIVKRHTALTAEDACTVCVIFAHVDDTAATGRPVPR
jgi:hypothetical protein